MAKEPLAEDDEAAIERWAHQQQKIYDQILDGADEQTLRRGLREFQAGTMIDAGLAKAVEGITTIRELTRLGMQSHGRNA